MVPASDVIVNAARLRYAAIWLLIASSCAFGATAPSSPKDSIRIDDASIPMPDGVRLAADLFVPAGSAKGKRFPVLLEYLPYRKNEARGRNYALYSYFVRHGYIVARVDIRGTGQSEGHLI